MNTPNDGQSTVGQSLTDIRSARIRMKAAERAVWWALADLEADAVRQAGRQIIGDLAADTGEGVSTVRDRIHVAAQFPERAGLDGATPALLRACIQAAGRAAAAGTPELASRIAQRALAAGMSAADVANEYTGEAPVEPPRCATCGRVNRA